jgi:hypothetical protein
VIILHDTQHVNPNVLKPTSQAASTACWNVLDNLLNGISL